MKILLRLKTTIISLFVLFTIVLDAQEIGMSWEFNEDGNFEGIILSNNFKDSVVENGLLKATVANVFPFISSEPFELEAADYGIVQIRMKIPGASSGKFNWYNDTGDWGFIIFEAAGDTIFQEFELPVYLNDKWSGKITKIMSLGFNPTVGSQVEIDYIRIVRKGPEPGITNFTPIRTIFKQNKEIPLFATVMNEGDVETRLNSKLTLSEGVTLVNGSLENDHGTMFKELTDSLNWIIMFNDLGKYDISLKLFNESDTTERIYSFNVTDKYWDPDEFLLSTWSPPYAWYGAPYEDEVFEYYKNANINNVLWVRPDDDLIAMVKKYDLKYYLLVTNVVGGDIYLRAPDKETPPDITEEMLLDLDNVIEKYIDDPNLLGYHICDEPHEPAFPNIGKVVERIREKDPTRLSFVNIWPSGNGYREYIDGLLQIAKLELLSYDRYHFHNGYDEEASYFSNLNVIREYALKYDIPFCNIIQAIGTNGTVEEHLDWRTPNEAEHRWLVYSSLAYGVHGLVWFHWHLSWGLTGNPDRDIIYPSIQSINAEIDSLTQIMLHLTTTGAYHTITNESKWQLPPDGFVKSVSENADLVIGYFKDDDENDYFMLMNKDYSNSSTIKVTLNGTTDNLIYFDVDSSKWQNVSYIDTTGNSVFEVDLRPGGGKLFKVGTLTYIQNNSSNILPEKFELKQNYPNPFNPSTTIEYSIPVDSKQYTVGSSQHQSSNQPIIQSNNSGLNSVTLKIYDILGREVAILVNKRQQPGNYKVQWNGKDGNDLKVSSGVYIYRLKAGSLIRTRKMMLLQ